MVFFTVVWSQPSVSLRCEESDTVRSGCPQMFRKLQVVCWTAGAFPANARVVSGRRKISLLPFAAKLPKAPKLRWEAQYLVARIKFFFCVDRIIQSGSLHSVCCAWKVYKKPRKNAKQVVKKDLKSGLFSGKKIFSSWSTIRAPLTP